MGELLYKIIGASSQELAPMFESYRFFAAVFAGGRFLGGNFIPLKVTNLLSSRYKKFGALNVEVPCLHLMLRCLWNRQRLYRVNPVRIRNYTQDIILEVPTDLTFKSYFLYSRHRPWR